MTFMNKENITRQVFCDDALAWLNAFSETSGHSFLGSLPDISEFSGSSLEDWKLWFQNTAELILEKTSPEGVTIFFQSDIKHEGLWVDKAYMIQKSAEKLKHNLLFHKIFCRAQPGTIMFGRPSYSHMLCFSRTVLPDLAKSTADVVPELGEKTWIRGMGLEASLVAAQFVLKHTTTKTLVNPFCGEGSVVAAANFVGLNAIGIERSPKRAEKARELQITDSGKSFSSSL
jgi:hypothetical protein